MPNDWPEQHIGEYVRSESVDRFTLKEGMAVAADSKVALKFSSPKVELQRIDGLPNSGMIPVVSSRIADVLRQYAGADCQLIDCAVHAVDGVLYGYCAVVAKRRVSVLDRLSSLYSVVPGTDAIMSIRHFVAKPKGLCGLSMARDSEYLSNLYVSKDLRMAIQEVNPPGIAFYLPEEFYS